jgi:hypothetical protein
LAGAAISSERNGACSIRHRLEARLLERPQEVARLQLRIVLVLGRLAA